VDRADFVGDFIGHIKYILCNFVPFIGSGWSRLMLPRGGWMIVGYLVLAFSFVGCISIAAQWHGRKFFASLALIACAFASSAPQVFLIGDVWAFRTHYPMAVIVGITAWIGLSALLPRRRIALLSVLVSVVLFLCAAWAVNLGMAYSAIREYHITRGQLEQLQQSGAKKAYVITTPDKLDAQPPLPIRWHSCYGFISIILMNNFQVMAVEREVWPDVKTRPSLTYIKADQWPSIPHDDWPVLDLWGEISGHATPLQTQDQEP
jgi:hypothetical protein